ncbi:MAG: chromosome segregation SMC family protein, partial [Acidimicrobiales bacterium]
MYLKSLTLRGFKSFADPTTLEFESGVTVIVGPNGSGKSNVVDAVAWVLGAQGPSAVRSAKMDDVIFSGTAKRAQLGRAEVALTIDNSSRRLPVDLAEVTISRTLFRTGDSEYSMNGVSCRLLDVQELLSDAGIGRQQHVIVGQGQLDTVLGARPEDRRAVIEEAAGVLKFRRRRERAERRLLATEENLTRLSDLQREVHRQLRPLERQAEAARRHDQVAGELRALRLHLSGRELRRLHSRLELGDQSRADSKKEEDRLSAELSALDSTVASAEADLSTEEPARAAGELSRAERLLERAGGLGALIAERRRGIEAFLELGDHSAAVPVLEAEMCTIDEELADLAPSLEVLGAERDEAAAQLAELKAQSSALSAQGPAAATALDAIPGAAPGTIPGSEADADLTAARRHREQSANRLGTAREGLARLGERVLAIERNRDDLARSREDVLASIGALGADLDAKRARLEGTEAAERAAARAVTDQEQHAREKAGHKESLLARALALETALAEAHARTGLERLGGREGVLGTLSDVVVVETGYEKAFEAAAFEALEAVVVDGGSLARRALDHLAGTGGGAVL